MMRATQSDRGFSVLEVLVALAIASTAMVALGALFQLAMRVSETMATSKRVHTALLDLQGVLQVLEEKQDEVHGATGRSFDLTSPNAEAIAHVTLGAENAEGRELLVSGPSGSTRADLAIFEDARLEYLYRIEPSTLRWAEAVPAPDAVLGARLRLTLGERVWRPLIWIVSPIDPRTLAVAP
jgi:prepilin-type N-terminal cleavage/methylation domain-containing protein